MTFGPERPSFPAPKSAAPILLLAQGKLEFEVPKDLPRETRKLMMEAIDMSMRKLKATEQKLAELRRKLEVDEG
jgi:hypothetical protein